MNNIINSLTKFAKNKNTVTILGVLVVLGLLYWGYSSQVNAAVAPVQVPISNTTIQPRTQITPSMIDTIEIAGIAVVENVYTNSNAVIGMYTNVNAVIPKGSMFYREALIAKEQLPDSAFVDLPEGTIPYLFPVSFQSTFGNSIFPDSKVDIYMKAQDSDGKIMIGKLLEDVEVLAVRDSEGRDVFENTDENRTPAYLFFALEDDIHILLRKATYVQGGIELFPIPHGGTVKTEGETRVSTEYLKDFILSKSIILPGQETNSLNNIKDSSEDKTNTETSTDINKR